MPRYLAPEQRRRDLLDASRSVLGEKGYEATTVSEIVNRAAVGQGTFYNFFAAKTALPLAFATEMMAAMAEATDAAWGPAASLPDAVDDVVDAIYRVASEFADVLLVAGRATSLASDEESWLAVTEPLRASLERMIRRFQEEGEVDATLSPATTARVATDLLDHSARGATLFRREEVVAEIKRMFLRVLEAC